MYLRKKNEEMFHRLDDRLWKFRYELLREEHRQLQEALLEETLQTKIARWVYYHTHKKDIVKRLGFLPWREVRRISDRQYMELRNRPQPPKDGGWYRG